MQRHIGKLRNTDQRVVVAFMQIPDREDHALIISTDSLPDRFEQALMDVVESQEGQSDPVLANVLSRRLLPDTGENLFQALHNRGLLNAVHVDQVIMLPQPNMPFPLTEVLNKMGKTVQTRDPSVSDEALNKFNPALNNIKARTSEERLGIAGNLIAEAEDLENVARAKREQAYSVAPELRPVTAAENAASSVLVETATTAKRSASRKKSKATE